MKSVGIYIHIPFCIKKCHYCDFCSYQSTVYDMAEYCRELCRRIEEKSEDCREYTVDTVYFGGGTPTLLPKDLLGGVMECVKSNYNLSKDAEITCECNPATADIDYFKAMRKMGINRLSIGLQSANDAELALLGRAHSVSDFKSAYIEARAAEFDNISVDLMYGIPDQTLESFEKSVKFVCELSPEHISSYGLKIEEGTRFGKIRDTLILPNEDTEYNMYLMLTRELEKHGYHKYEISNFSREGYPSRHNMRYWESKEYIGFGVAAHSYFGGERYGNSRDMAAFLRGEDITEERRALGESEKNDEYVMLGLRLASGIEMAELQKRFPDTYTSKREKIEQMVKNGFMTECLGRAAFTDKGFFVSNYIISELLDFE